MSNFKQQDYLENTPQDTITNLAYHPTRPNLLLSSSLDKTIRLYDTDAIELKTKISHDSPILDCCFGYDDIVFTGCLDGHVCSIDLSTKQKTDVGCHSKGARSVCWSSLRNALYSGSWDKTISVWITQMNNAVILEHMLPHKVISMDLRDNFLAVAMEQQQILIFDIRKFNVPWKAYTLKLSSTPKTIRLMSEGKGAVCSSVCGNLSVDYFGKNQEQRYDFMLLKPVPGGATLVYSMGKKLVYPVNSLAMHPTLDAFALGDSGGTVNIWSIGTQKRMLTFPEYPGEISNVIFNNNASQLAIGSSYVYGEGGQSTTSSAIFIKILCRHNLGMEEQ
ncbi:unnamed protein product [Absidia cylindrospora]